MNVFSFIKFLLMSSEPQREGLQIEPGKREARFLPIAVLAIVGMCTRGAVAKAKEKGPAVAAERAREESE